MLTGMWNKIICVLKNLYFTCSNSLWHFSLENIKDFITKEVISAEASDASSYEDPQALQVLIQDLKSEDTNTV